MNKKMTIREGRTIALVFFEVSSPELDDQHKKIVKLLKKKSQVLSNPWAIIRTEIETARNQANEVTRLLKEVHRDMVGAGAKFKEMSDEKSYSFVSMYYSVPYSSLSDVQDIGNNYGFKIETVDQEF